MKKISCSYESPNIHFVVALLYRKSSNYTHLRWKVRKNSDLYKMEELSLFRQKNFVYSVHRFSDILSVEFILFCLWNLLILYLELMPNSWAQLFHLCTYWKWHWASRRPQQKHIFLVDHFNVKPYWGCFYMFIMCTLQSSP